MQRCRYLWTTSAVVALAGCPADPVCGPGDAPADGLTATGGGVTVRYGAVAAGANNDCPAPDAPAGVVSLTVHGRQLEPAGAAVFGVCLPRPDRIADGTVLPLVRTPATVGEQAQLVDLQGALDADCRWTATGEPTGTATFGGFCADGTAADGFALTLDATVPMTRACSGLPDEAVTVALAGTVAVSPE